MPQANPAFLKDRAAKFDAIAAKQGKRLADKPRIEITIALPDGTEKKGVSYETTPMDIAKVMRWSGMVADGDGDGASSHFAGSGTIKL